jgi:hypothetical protein
MRCLLLRLAIKGAATEQTEGKAKSGTQKSDYLLTKLFTGKSNTYARG